jgi:ketosteroid isomerase-like protein
VSSTPVRDGDPIAAYHNRYIQAALSSDIASLVSLCSDNIVFMPPNETSIFGKSELQEWHEDYFLHFRVASLSETDREVIVLDGWAVERWDYLVTISPLNGADRIRDEGRFLIVWRREEDGAWKMAKVMFNSIRPIGSGTIRFLARMTSAD